MDKNITRETHKEVIEKELPTIVYRTQNMKSMTDRMDTYISVSGNTSKDALDTFKELKKVIK